MKRLVQLPVFFILFALLSMATKAAEPATAPQGQANAGNGPYTAERPLVVGMLLFDGFEMLDVFGPLEMFGDLGDRVRIVTLGMQKGLVRPRNGPAVEIEQTLADAGALDLFIIPGGLGTRREVNNSALVTALKTLSDRTPKVASVCTGAALLARTGLLDGLSATTNKMAFDWVSQQGTAVHWVADARWVDSGKFATSSGVSAGIDLALGLIAQLFDRATAERVARNTEYVWNSDPANDPFARVLQQP
jgi:transcriptional regulator GlxA family with amidase domain